VPGVGQQRQRGRQDSGGQLDDEDDEDEKEYPAQARRVLRAAAQCLPVVVGTRG
jgi:hypothetical protein